MRRAAIVMPMRTPVGMTGGALATVPPHRLAGTVIAAVLGRTGLDPARVDQFVTAVPDSQAIRPALAHCGLSPELADFALGDGPGSGLRALITAAMMVRSGTADVVLTLGADHPVVEHPCATAGFAPQPTSVPFGPTSSAASRGTAGPSTDEQIALWASMKPSRAQSNSPRLEDLAREHGLTRADADDYAAASHRRAARAHRQGRFGQEIAPVVVLADPGDPHSGVVSLVDRDESLRDDVSARAFAALPPFHPGGATTLGNSSIRTVAASACLVVAEERLTDLGLEPLAFLIDWTNTAAPSNPSEPSTRTETIPTAAAAAKSLWRSGFDLSDLPLLEIEETSAVEVLAAARALNLPDGDHDRLNVHGGSIALGEPGGAAGLRMVTTLLHELSRRDGNLALAATPTGPHTALAALFESPESDPISVTPRGARFRGAGNRRPPKGRHRN
ncbi:acetyl-CoA C-acyltransferase [Nocardia yunnanensis]|nr:acetyl-CoA C-acyltransferase [Nocardia yunnanensis]